MAKIYLMCHLMVVGLRPVSAAMPWMVLSPASTAATRLCMGVSPGMASNRYASTRGPCEPVAINKPPKQLAPFNKGATPYDRRL